MKTTTLAPLLCLALGPACVAGDPGSADTGTTTVTLTAADLAGGARPQIDLTIDGVHWSVDAREGRVDLERIDVITERETVALAVFLEEVLSLDAAAVDELGVTGLELWAWHVTTPAPGVEQRELGQELGRTACKQQEACDDHGDCVSYRACTSASVTYVAGGIGTSPS